MCRPHPSINHYEAEREHRDFDREIHTDTLLRKTGVEVIGIKRSELDRTAAAGTA